MAVQTVAEQFDREGTQDEYWHRTYRRTWVVETNSPYDGPLTVRAALPVGVGYAYRIFDASGNQVEYDYGTYVNKITCRCVSKDGQQWICTADYGTYNPSIFPQNPLQWPLKISWGTTKFERVVMYDAAANAVLNSAGQYFDPPLTADDSRINLKIERNQAYFDASVVAIYKDALNADVFFGGAPGTWKVEGITADLEYNNDSGTPDGFYYKVTYTFEYRAEGWNSPVLDQGLYQLDGSGNLTPILDDNGSPVTQPALLDGTGHELPSTGTPTFISYVLYNSQPYFALGLNPLGQPGQG